MLRFAEKSFTERLGIVFDRKRRRRGGGARGQVGDQFPVGGEEIVGGKGAGALPKDLLEGEIARLGGELGGEENQLDAIGKLGLRGVAVAGAILLGADGAGDAEFFFEFAGEGLWQGLAWFDFAAGEFPRQWERAAARTLAD